jgi:hypothetical protein
MYRNIIALVVLVLAALSLVACGASQKSAMKQVGADRLGLQYDHAFVVCQELPGSEAATANAAMMNGGLCGSAIRPTVSACTSVRGLTGKHTPVMMTWCSTSSRIVSSEATSHRSAFDAPPRRSGSGSTRRKRTRGKSSRSSDQTQTPRLISRGVCFFIFRKIKISARRGVI